MCKYPNFKVECRYYVNYNQAQTYGNLTQELLDSILEDGETLTESEAADIAVAWNGHSLDKFPVPQIDSKYILSPEVRYFQHTGNMEEFKRISEAKFAILGYLQGAKIREKHWGVYKSGIELCDTMLAGEQVYYAFYRLVFSLANIASVLLHRHQRKQSKEPPRDVAHDRKKPALDGIDEPLKAIQSVIEWAKKAGGDDDDG
ncbi:MAG: hypothetical protein FWH07_08090 [Oscillospiraceae bacterium]|nr:hypothetical protein [Oscillospiraceae bacterium]